MNSKKSQVEIGSPQTAVLTTSLKKNIELIKALFKDNDTLIVREIENLDGAMKYCIVYFDGVVNSIIINEDIVKPLMRTDIKNLDGTLIDILIKKVILINEVKKTEKIGDIIESVTYGDTILFADGAAEAIILNSKGFQTRSINEPESEKILSGPREGFCESLLLNLSMIRRKVRSTELKMKFYSLGRRTNTQACICYIDGLVNKDILSELYSRLDKIDMDGVIDTNYITEIIKDAPFSLFKTIGSTERPDVVAGKLLEGRIAVFVDGSPVVLTLPYLFIENFQSNEDYYLNFYYTSFSRLLRIFAFILTVCVPAFYVAIVAFHHEMLPTSLLIHVAMERKNVPLPAAVEAFVMLIVFDILRETGIRMPTGVGQALSIVGALVIGQAAVEAKMIAAPMIIIVGITGITNLLVPKLNTSVIYLRFFLLALSSVLGYFGFIIGVSLILIHILKLRSFGIPSMAIPNIKYQNMKDIYIRGPWQKMITRREIIAQDNIRMNISGGDKNE
ncbi:MAG: spore germination protein [Clostridia bacterium]|nr:spore germination protein [Clostridia bacterium]